MDNLLKMNLFRMVRTRMMYVMAAIGAIFSTVMLLVIGIVLSSVGEDELAVLMLMPSDTLVGMLMYTGQSMCLPISTMMFTVLFFNSERSSGYLKNLVGYRGNKYAVAGANAITAALFAFAVMVLSYIIGTVMSVGFFHTSEVGKLSALSAYIVVSFVETMAFVLLIQAWADASKKPVLIMILGMVFLMYAPGIAQLVNLGIQLIGNNPDFNLQKYTLLGCMSSFSETVNTTKDFCISGAIALGGLVLGFFLDVLALKRQEIK